VTAPAPGPLARVRGWPSWLREGLAVLAVALAAGGFAIAFRGLFKLVFERVFGAPDVVEAMRALPAPLRLISPALGGLVAGLMGMLAARGRPGRGIADVMEAVAVGRAPASLWAVVVKAMASFAAITGGGSVGREGPFIQFGGASAGALAGLFDLQDRKRRALVAAGAAAGFAAAYNTPIAAVLFVLEIVTGVITFRVVLPVVLATVGATVLTRAMVGGGPLYGLRSFTLQSPLELLVHAALGCIAAVVAVAFMVLLRQAERAFARLPLPLPLRAAAGGLIVGAIAIALPEITGNGYEVIQWTLDGRFGARLLGLLLVAKAVATTSSVSSGSPGGVFTPSMFLGAALGGLVGQAALLLGLPGGGTGGYVLVGMAATVAATTHAPVMATVLGFELCGDYGVVLPLFLATVIATGLSRRLHRQSIYTAELKPHPS
jgi:CIC family chloride channel protein